MVTEKYAVKVTNKEDFATKCMIDVFTPRDKVKRAIQDKIVRLMERKDAYLDRYAEERKKLVFALYDVEVK